MGHPQLDTSTEPPLFEAPPGRLGRRLHAEVFGELPFGTARALDVPEVAAAVRPLLAGGWRPAQLGARVGALPAQEEPVPAVVAFLQALLERDSPQRAWSKQRDQADADAQRVEVRAVASEQARAHWVRQARLALGMAASDGKAPAPRPETPPACSACAQASAYFVTREVRLCAACVALLGSGRARLAVGA